MITSLLAASVATPRDPSAIINGQEAANCAWPSVVGLSDGGASMICSGTLVHPYIVVTAAHCFSAANISRVLFGQSEADIDLAVDTEFCAVNPEFPVEATTTAEFDNTDFAFCKLTAPVENVPIIPIAYGCEVDAIEPGVELVAVGFGRTQTASDDSGTKRFGQSVLTEIDVAGELVSESITCYGDSGGPYFMQLPGGELRQVGITSYGQTEICSSASVSTAASQLVPFVFEMTGIDIAACHGPDGEWAPTGACGGVPLEPHIGGNGNYVDGCPTGALSGFESTCGPSIEETPDTTAPTVAIISPQANEMIDSMGGQAMLPIELEADDGDGWGVAIVELVIEDAEGGGNDTQQGATPPYRWTATLPNGAYYLRGVAEDYAGNRGESDWVGVGVGVPPPPPREDEEETTSGGSSSDDGSESTSTTASDAEPPEESTGDVDEAGDATEDRGCGCRSTPAPGSAMVLVVLTAIRRRRRR